MIIAVSLNPLETLIDPLIVGQVAVDVWPSRAGRELRARGGAPARVRRRRRQGQLAGLQGEEGAGALQHAHRKTAGIMIIRFCLDAHIDLVLYKISSP